MVQRKVPNQHGIQADNVKSERRLGNFKPSSPHNQDAKNRVSDQKKKMKKSRSIKRPDFESLQSPAFRRVVAEPWKPQTLDVPACSATLQKQFLFKGSDASPNYMKSTRSFNARKEQTQVSFQSPQTFVDMKRPKKIWNSNNSPISGQKPAKTLSRTSSLKLVRTLKKAPSFKLTKASTKKCSQVVLCENLNVERATCSSTLKDSKFPTYLALNPGATESEGTSVMRVCPYTYCSLSGHRHAPSPPLKSFLLARRRILKTQKRMKLGCLSPHRANPSDDRIKEISGKITLDETPIIQELDSNSPRINPLIQEDQMDFFIEVYVRGDVDAAENTGRSKQNDDEHDEMNFSINDFISSVDWSKETVAEDDGGQVESCSNEARCLEIGSVGNCLNSGEINLTEMEVAEEVDSPSTSHVEETSECLSNQRGFKIESPQSTELDGTDSETSDMKWEEGQYLAQSLDDDVDNSAQANNENDLESVSSCGNDNPNFFKDLICKSDDIVSSYFDEIPSDEGLEEFFEEEYASSDTESSYKNLGSGESIQEINKQKYPVSIIYEVLEKSTMDEIGEHAESDEFVTSVICLLSPTSEYPKTNQSLKQEIPIADTGNEMQEEEQEDASKSVIRIPTSGTTEEDNNGFQLGVMTKDGESNQSFVDEGLLAETPVHSSNEQSQIGNIIEDQNYSWKDCHEDQSIKISDSLNSEDQIHSGLNNVSVALNSNKDANEMEVQYSTLPGQEESLTSSRDAAITKARTAFIRGKCHSRQELPEVLNHMRIIRCKRSVEELEETRKFNPREPNYLPIELDPESEKVDLIHQMMEERKNAEEWMLDHALQQAVTNLAPARKGKVVLLVEAFEKVMPLPKYESHLRHPSAACAHARPIQACNRPRLSEINTM
ncbi:hypothetical protein U1Q18_022738 [Sarracenia purpurea var. burkii]